MSRGGKKRSKASPPVPSERGDTIRHEVARFITGAPSSAGEISSAISIAEKEVYEHLEHIRRSVAREGRELEVIPAKCTRCGFVFKKRVKLKPPGRCPICKSESIEDPQFMLS